ncbi:MAG: hypothetical protein FJZ87_12860, partial [Chloroflexi bacterium]|nr:hypothetical protein [Chloroflexota bacterium]
MQLLRELGVLVLWLSLFSGLVYVFKSISKSGWRLAALEAFVFTGFLAWSITETLSAFEAVTLTGIVVSWGIIGLVVSVLVLRILREPERPTLTKALAALATNARQLPKGTVFLLVYLFFSVSVLGLIAIVAPPNSSDAMTYHMSRVMHWQQNRSLDMYPTGILRQLDLGPMAEIGILHLQTLAGSDRLANLVQFFSLLGSLIGVTLIAELLGGNVQAQVFSVMTVLTLPMGILQATSAQNDLVVSLWLVCFVTFLLVQMRGRITLPLCLFAGIALGLALNTKATAYQFGLPFGLWFFSHLLKRERSKTIKPLAFLLGAAAFILVPQYVRNANLFSNPFGTGHDLRNSLISPATAASNILRNLAIHAATPIEPLNDYFEERIEAVHEAVGLDMHDSRTTWMETHFTVDFSNQDDLAGNPLHLALILLAMPGLLLSNRRDRIALLTCF